MISLKHVALVFLGLFFLAQIVCAEPVPPAIQKAIKPLAIQSVDLSSGVLRVVMSRPLVTLDMYHAVAIVGGCYSLFGNPKAWGNAKINRIEVLNDIAAQGYALDDASHSCKALGSLTQEQERKYIADHTLAK